MRKRRKSDDGGFNIWRSYSDMMAGVLLLFVLIMCVTLFQAQKNYNDSVREKDERLSMEKAYTAELEERQAELEKLAAQLSHQKETLEEQEKTLSEQKSKLDEQTEQLESQKSKLDEQTEQLASQKSKLDEQTEQLASQKNKLDEQTEQLASQKSKLDEQTEQLASQKSKLDEQTEQLAQQKSQLDEQTTQLSTQQTQLTEQTEQLAQQKSKLDEQAAQLASQQTQLDEQAVKLEAQQTALDEKTQLLSAQQKKIDNIIGVKANVVEALRQEFAQNDMNVNIDKDSGAMTLESNVIFDYDEIVLKEEGQEVLAQVLPIYCSVLIKKEYLPYLAEITIDGYTDSLGDYYHNLYLSQGRSHAVAEYLLELMPYYFDEEEIVTLMDHLSVNAHSMSNFIYDEDGNIDDDASRRVEVKFRLKDEEMIQELNKILSE